MSVQFIRGTEVNRPTPDPLTSSVLDHAEVVDNAEFGWRNNEGMWPTYNTLDTLVPTQLCPDPVAVKTFAFGRWVPAYEFAVYGGVQCKAVGLDTQDMAAEVKRVFALNEGKGIERSLLENRFVARTNGSDETGPEWDAATDLTPAGTISPVIALALLEGYAAANYAGLPTIHMPRAAATVLENQGLISWTGDKAFTKNQSKVAIGGGYDSSDFDGTWDMYATGEVYVERSDEVNITANVVPGDGNSPDSDGTGISSNSVLALAERMYRVAIDPISEDADVVKVTATVWSA